MEEVEAEGKGEHSYYKQRDTALHRSEETVTWWMSDTGC